MKKSPTPLSTLFLDYQAIITRLRNLLQEELKSKISTSAEDIAINNLYLPIQNVLDIQVRQVISIRSHYKYPGSTKYVQINSTL